MRVLVRMNVSHGHTSATRNRINAIREHVNLPRERTDAILRQVITRNDLMSARAAHADMSPVRVNFEPWTVQSAHQSPGPERPETQRL